MAKVNHVIVSDILDGARSLLGPKLGDQAAAAVLRKIATKLADDVVVYNLDVSSARYVEYTFVRTFLPPIIAAVSKALTAALVITCHLDVDSYEIRKGLVYGAVGTLPPPGQWDSSIAELGRFVVLASANARDRQYQYVGTAEPKMLDTLRGVTDAETGCTVAEFARVHGIDSTETVHRFEQLIARRLIFETGRTAQPQGERVFIAATRLFEGDRHGVTIR